MPTPAGLLKPGERWRLTVTLPPDWKPEAVDVLVLARGTGSYWSLRVKHLDTGREQLWVDAAAWFAGANGSHKLTYVAPFADD